MSLKDAMDSADGIISDNKPTASIEDVNRLLDVGRLLKSVIKPEELNAIQMFFSEAPIEDEIGNAGDSWREILITIRFAST